MGEADERRSQQAWLRRLRAMGAQAELEPGGRCVHARLRLGPEPFPGLDRPLRIEELGFATVGRVRIKCLSPRPLFHLPLLDVGGCVDAAALEARVRSAWAAHVAGLARARGALEALGVAAEAEHQGAVLAFALNLEQPDARGRTHDGNRIVLPSRGPAGGLPLSRAGDRWMRADRSWESATDLEIAVTNVLERLARDAGHTEAMRRLGRARRAAEPPARRPVSRGAHRLLLVGPRLASDVALQQGLRQQGYRVEVVRSVDSALEAFGRLTFEVILADADLGRAEGLELVPALDALPGVGKLPVILVDDHVRQARREAARRVGAAGYLVHPVEAAQIAPGLARMAAGSRGRRFDRFRQRLAVDWSQDGGGGFTTALSRLGLFIRTDRDLGPGHVSRCRLALPELGRQLELEVESLYRLHEVGSAGAGIGVRIRTFPSGAEPLWIEYLAALVERQPSR